MTSLTNLRTGLATRLATITGLRVFDHVPDVFAPPCAFVLPDTIDYWEGFSGGDAQHRWTVTIIVGRSADRAAQRSLFEYISYSGTKSVRAAIEADRTLGGVCQTLLVERADNIRMLTQGDANYLAADFAVRIHA